MLSGLPALTYVTKKLCGQRISGGAGGGDFTAAGRNILLSADIREPKDIPRFTSQLGIFTMDVHADGRVELNADKSGLRGESIRWYTL